MGDNTDFASGSTFAGMPAGCAAAIRTLQIFERDHIVAHAKRLGNIAAGIMREWEKYNIVRQARGNGLLLGVSFGKPDSAGPMKKTGGRLGLFAERCLKMACGQFPIAKTRFVCIPRSTWRSPCFVKDCKSWKTPSGTSKNTGTRKVTQQRTRVASRLSLIPPAEYCDQKSNMARALPSRFVLAVTVGGVIGLGILRGPGEIAEVVPDPLCILRSGSLADCSYC